MAEILDEGVAPQMGGGGSVSGVNTATANLARRSSYEGTFTATAKNLVKGAGHVSTGVPLHDVNDAGAILTKSQQAILNTKAATFEGVHNAESVLGGISND